MSNGFILFIVAWCVFFIVIMAIGGFFMFRKFLKSMPKEDGKSTLDWQDYYIHTALHLWDEQGKNLLNELVSPVPELFRNVAKSKIAGKISQIALDKKVEIISFDEIIQGYIEATPERDHKFLRKKLNEMNIQVENYEHFFKKQSA